MIVSIAIGLFVDCFDCFSIDLIDVRILCQVSIVCAVFVCVKRRSNDDSDDKPNIHEDVEMKAGNGEYNSTALVRQSDRYTTLRPEEENYTSVPTHDTRYTSFHDGQEDERYTAFEDAESDRYTAFHDES